MVHDGPDILSAICHVPYHVRRRRACRRGCRANRALRAEQRCVRADPLGSADTNKPESAICANGVGPSRLLENHEFWANDRPPGSYPKTGVMSGLATRTKPQAPRSLRQWLARSFEAGIGCGHRRYPTVTHLRRKMLNRFSTGRYDRAT
jgi:hypothetical protein